MDLDRLSRFDPARVWPDAVLLRGGGLDLVRDGVLVRAVGDAEGALDELRQRTCMPRISRQLYTPRTNARDNDDGSGRRGRGGSRKDSRWKPSWPDGLSVTLMLAPCIALQHSTQPSRNGETNSSWATRRQYSNPTL